MQQYIKPVEAVKLTDENIESVVTWMNGLGELQKDYKGRYILVSIIENFGTAGIGQWIVRERDGHFQIVSDADFKKRYTPSPAKAEQQGLRWVKASAQLPPNVNKSYNAKRDGNPFILLFLEADKKMPKDYWDGVWYLDESTTPPVKEVAYDELWDEFSEHIDDDIDSLFRVAGGSVLTERQYNKLVAKLKAAPVKEAGQPVDGLTIADYEEVLADKKRLVREIDVIINGENAAKQASLVDLIPKIRELVKSRQQPAPSGLRWVKASERLPEAHADKPVIVRSLRSGMVRKTKHFGRTDGWDVGMESDFQYHNTEWLDESDSPTPVQVDPVAVFVEWLDIQRDTNSPIWEDKSLWSQEGTFKVVLEKYTQSLQNKP